MSIYDHTPPPLFPASPSKEADHLRPSIFELLATEQLHELFGPVVRYTLAYLAQRYPARLARLARFHPELAAVLLGLVEDYHLRRHNASISEYFYGLNLVHSFSLSSRRPRRLRRRQRWALLFFLVGLPYLRQRAQTYYDQLCDCADPGPSASSASATLSDKLRRAFILSFPYLDLTYALCLLSFDLRFLFDRTPFHRPWHALLGVSLRRVDPDSDSDPDAYPRGTGDAGLTTYLPPLLPPLLLALKFSQWWYSPGSPRPLPDPGGRTAHALVDPPRPLPILQGSGLLTPPPSGPSSPALSPSSVGDAGTVPPLAKDLDLVQTKEYTVSSEEYGRCPLCGRKWQNPAVLPSGWVVCWRCGWDAVEGEVGDGERQGDGGGEGQRGRRGRCPITGVEVRPGQLRRVLV